MSQNLNKKRILIAAMHFPIASGRYIARALRRMGHDVKTAGPYMGRQVWGMELPEGAEWVPDFSCGGTGEPIPLPPIAGWEPDLVIVADSAFAITVRSWANCPHIVYGVDNHVRDYRLGVEWDYKFLAHGNGARMDDENTVHLPCAYDPEWFTRQTMPWQRPVHAAMVGVMYPRRQEIMWKLAAKGMRVQASTGPIMEEYARIYNNAVVSVCKSVAGDVAQRVFETAAMGCVIVSDRCHDFDALGFEEGVHYLGYETPDEAVEVVADLFAGPDERINELAENAYRWAQPHTWDARCQMILNTVFGGDDGTQA